MAAGWVGIALISDERWGFQCPKPYCYFSVSAKDEPSAYEIEATHKCPFGGTVHFSGSITMMLVEKMWAQVDEVYANLVQSNKAYFSGEDTSVTSDDVAVLRGKCRGICEMIAIFMPPHFTTADAVGREVMHRYKMKEAGEPYETPGIQSRRYDLPDNKERPRVAQIKHNLTDEQIAGIKHALKPPSLFTVEQVASTFGVTPAVIRQVNA